MSKSMNVTFDDGTSHTFDEVPDDVTQEQVNAKAAEMFPDRKISDTNEGAHPEAPPLPTAEQQAAQQPSLGTQALGAAQTVGGLAMAHPGIAAGAAGLYKANQFANKYMAGKEIDRTIAQQQASTAADAQALARERMAERVARTAPVEPTNMNAQRPMGFVNTNTPPPSGPTASAPVQPSQMPQMGQAQPAANMARPGMPAPGMTAPPAPPPVGGPAAQQGSNFIENIAQKYSQIAQKFAPAMQGIAESPLGRVAGGAMRIAGSTPVMGAQLALHSGGLNTNEDQLLADKHRLEAQMLLNKHAAEWSKYQKAKQTVQGQ